MSYLIVCASAAVIGLLTLFSGFGLGTLLMPVFAIFFPVEVAVGATAVVHLANNVFKLALVGRDAVRSVVLRFGLPAVVAAFGGAWLLAVMSAMPAIATYSLWGRTCRVTVVKLVIAVLIVGFALIDLLPAFQRLSLDRKYLPIGGLLSGFFGGLSGHQGALRSAFLIKLGLSTRQFVATGVVVAVMVDLARLLVYGAGAASREFDGHLAGLVAAACAAAFSGTFIASRLLDKVAIDAVRAIVAAMLIALGLALGTGLV